jgi:hypothetical protein
MSKRDWLLDQGWEGAILEPEYLDEAIIGISHDDRAVYSYSKLVDAFMKHDGMTYEDAVEWISYNTIRSIPYMGDYPPIIVMEPEEEEV